MAVGDETQEVGPPTEKRKRISFLKFLGESWAELQKVQWPNRKQVGQATAVVLGFVIVAGSFLGLTDFVAGKVVELII